MFIDTDSLKSSESSVFEPNPESLDQRLIRKSIEEEGLLATSSTPTKGNRANQHNSFDFRDSKVLLSVPDYKDCHSFTSESLSLCQKLPRFPKLPALPSTESPDLSIKGDQMTNSLPKMPNHWNFYPIVANPISKEETESLALTSGYTIPPTRSNKKAISRRRSVTSAQKNILTIKIFTNINDEVFVIREARDSFQTLNEILGPIIRKLERTYQVSPNSIKLFLSFPNKELLPVELFKGDPSSCVYSSLTEEYIQCRKKILVLAKVSI